MLGWAWRDEGRSGKFYSEEAICARVSATSFRDGNVSLWVVNVDSCCWFFLFCFVLRVVAEIEEGVLGYLFVGGGGGREERRILISAVVVRDLICIFFRG